MRERIQKSFDAELMNLSARTIATLDHGEYTPAFCHIQTHVMAETSKRVQAILLCAKHRAVQLKKDINLLDSS